MKHDHFYPLTSLYTADVRDNNDNKQIVGICRSAGISGIFIYIYRQTSCPQLCDKKLSLHPVSELASATSVQKQIVKKKVNV